MTKVEQVNLYVKSKMSQGCETFSIRQIMILFGFDEDTPVRKGIYKLKEQGYTPFRHKDNTDFFTIGSKKNAHLYREEILAEWSRDDKVAFNKLKRRNKFRKDYPIENQVDWSEVL